MMKMLELNEAIAQARRLGADDRQIARLKAWRLKGATDEEVKLYEDYRRKWVMGRARIELAIAHGMSPGTLRQRCRRGRMTIAQALRKPVADRSPALVEVRRKPDGRWSERRVLAAVED